MKREIVIIKSEGDFKGCTPHVKSIQHILADIKWVVAERYH